jgi:hypothetical protein
LQAESEDFQRVKTLYIPFWDVARTKAGSKSGLKSSKMGSNLWDFTAAWHRWRMAAVTWSGAKNPRSKRRLAEGL